MGKQTKATPVTKDNPNKVDPAIPTGKRETEFADELTNSDVESAFKNPVTGEERMY
ncbi:hypothetical protein [Paenibacillus sp. FSL R7-0273]|uniref:hypothetical protein n=1 Tax=Paenibacillus sp. FSL R7-0273 TaxID=1536772 RepID=UPI000A8FAF7C|nr:hypothetical protein [Paenibacillus sp. FSL R7-0273]